MGVKNFKKKKTLLTYLVVLTYLLTLLPIGIKTVRAEDLGVDAPLEQVELVPQEPVADVVVLQLSEAVPPIEQAVQIERVEIIADVLWTNVPDGVSKPGSTLKLLIGDVVIESKDYEPGSTKVTFTPVDKYDSTGNVITYRIEQEPIADFATTVDDFVVENTWSKPVEIPLEETPEEPPPVVEPPPTEETQPTEKILPTVEALVAEKTLPTKETTATEETIPTEETLPVEETPLTDKTIPTEETLLTEKTPELVTKDPLVSDPNLKLIPSTKETGTTEGTLPIAMASAAPIADIGIMAAFYSYDIYSYFSATGRSTNEHFVAKGVFIGTDNNVYLIIDNDKETASQFRFYNPMLNGYEALGYGQSYSLYENNWDGSTASPYTTSVVLNFPDDTNITISGKRMFIFNLGPLIDMLQVTNTLQMLNQAGGFSANINFTLNLGHTIDKAVVPTTATIGQEVIYTITVTNTGQFQLSNMDVLDTVPAETTVLEISKDGGTTWVKPTYTSGGVLVLDTAKTLYVGTPLIYKVKTFVNTTAENGDILVNKAYTGGSVVSQEDTATVTVQAVDVAVTKNITGNLGDLTRTFDFTLTISKGAISKHYPNPTEPSESFSFTLGDDGTFGDALNLPTDGVVTLSEVSMGYTVIVKVGNTIITPIDGVYTITLSGVDITIAVENNKDVIIPTGIALDTLPYILILLLLGAGVLGGVIRKRRHTDFD